MPYLIQQSKWKLFQNSLTLIQENALKKYMSENHKFKLLIF